MITAREAALLSLNEVLYNGKYSNLAVKDTLAKCRGMERVDKALYTNLVYGVVSHHYTLEYVIKQYSSVKPKKLARYVKLLLELGIYQILFMDKIPQSAAVNESVKLAKRYCKKGADRFVNAVLRAVCNGDIKYPDDRIEYLSVKHSFSMEMTKAFADNFGIDTAEKIMISINTAPSVTLRPNLMKTDGDELCGLLSDCGVTAEVCDDGLVRCDGFDVGESKLYRSGYFTPQDRGAYNAAIVLDPQAGECVIDMCAAPGGKTTHIAELMRDTGQVIACDIHPHKVKLIESNAKRLGLNCVTATEWDSCKRNPNFIGKADRVLCDVPCSGWGIIRRKPDIKLSHTELDELYGIQLAILRNGAEYVKDGGTLVYSTCTLNKLENENIINKFLETNDNFEKTYEKTYYPHECDSDGFYICRLDRK